MLCLWPYFSFLASLASSGRATLLGVKAEKPDLGKGLKVLLLSCLVLRRAPADSFSSLWQLLSLSPSFFLVAVVFPPAAKSQKEKKERKSETRLRPETGSPGASDSSTSPGRHPECSRARRKRPGASRADDRPFLARPPRRNPVAERWPRWPPGTRSPRPY